MCHVQVPRDISTARPILVEDEERWIIGRLIEIVVDAAFLFARRRDQREAFLFNFRLQARFGPDASYHRYFSVHFFFSLSKDQIQVTKFMPEILLTHGLFVGFFDLLG